MTGGGAMPPEGGADRLVYVVVDLTGSNCGPGWRSVELTMAMPLGWSTDRLRMEAAHYYAVPLEQVGQVTEEPTRDENWEADRVS